MHKEPQKSAHTAQLALRNDGRTVHSVASASAECVRGQPFRFGARSSAGRLECAVKSRNCRAKPSNSYLIKESEQPSITRSLLFLANSSGQNRIKIERGVAEEN